MGVLGSPVSESKAPFVLLGYKAFYHRNLFAEFGGLNGAVMSGRPGADHHHVVMLCRTIRSVHRTYYPVEVVTNEKQ